MLLSDRSIRGAIDLGHISVEPYDPALIQPASIDLRLGRGFRRTSGSNPSEYVGDRMTIYDGEFVLAHTLETVALPPDIAAQCDGKSSWGRRGLAVHVTAGWIDPGFRGQITLELHNVGKRWIELTAGEPIAQLKFFRLDRPSSRPYGSLGVGRYQNQTGPTPARTKGA